MQADLNAHLQPGYKAELAASPTQEGWDIRILGNDENVVEELQLKATNFSQYIKQALQDYPEIDVVTLEDLAGSFALLGDDRVTASAISNADLTNEISAATQAEFAMEYAGLYSVISLAALLTDGSIYNKGLAVGSRSAAYSINSSIVGSSMAIGGPLFAVASWFLKASVLSKGEKKARLKEALRRQLSLQEKVLNRWKKLTEGVFELKLENSKNLCSENSSTDKQLIPPFAIVLLALAMAVILLFNFHLANK